MKKILVDFSGNLIRMALVEDGTLIDLIIEDKENTSNVSNIYIGVVKNILPSQFVFLDIGEDKNAFLHLTDSKNSGLYKINDKGEKKLDLKLGQELLVQVLKDGTATKGASVTTQLSFTGRFLVLFNNCEEMEIGVSKKIIENSERKRLKEIAIENLPSGFGIIMRTECTSKTNEEILEELNKLIKICKNVEEKSKYIKGTCKVYKENENIGKTIMDLYDDDVSEIVVNDLKYIENIKEFVSNYYDQIQDKVIFYEEKELLFNHYSLESTIEKLLHKKIWLKSGGMLIIDQTEACVVIDVNTGKFTGNKNHKQTVLKTNLEAAVEIAKQMRLRNLSGMIIIDFIDMIDEKDKKKLYNIFLEELRADRISTNIVGMTRLGLMQVTRKKTREPISNILQSECISCNGVGKVTNNIYIADRIYKSVDSILANTIFNKIKISASKNVIKAFKGHEDYYKSLEKKYDAKIELAIIEVGRVDHFEIEKEKV